MKVNTAGKFISALESEWYKNDLGIHGVENEVFVVNEIKYHPRGESLVWCEGLSKMEKWDPARIIVLSDKTVNPLLGGLRVETVREILKVFDKETPIEFIVKSETGETAFEIVYEEDESRICFGDVLYR